MALPNLQARKEPHMSIHPATSPSLTKDPRFLAGRELVGDEGAVEVFGTLLESARTKFGEDHIETAPAYYEYGNAVLRRRQRVDDDPREAAAAAAEARMKIAEKSPPVGGDEDSKPEAQEADSNEDDLNLALEMMETAFSIMDKHSEENHDLYREWVKAQMPRVLTGLGDTLLELKRPADATDVYLRALEFRNAELESAVEGLDKLAKRRKIVEANILIVEALVTAPFDEDVVTSETKDVLVKSGSVLEYARGYYDRARDELQEALLLMGQLAAKGIDLGAEKEDVCYVATMVMGAGNTLAEIDEREESAHSTEEPMKKKAKHL